jgi:hypothetical protein
MENFVSKFKGLSFPLLAFAIPMVVRFIPEVISWPYPTGFDSLLYVGAMMQGFPFNDSYLIKYTSFFYVIAWVTYFLVGDLFLTMKILGSVIFSVFCGSLYIYAKTVLKWSNIKSLMVSVFAGTYFVSLGMSWQMYRMTLGLALLMISLAAARFERPKLRFAGLTVLCFLTVWTHEIAAITLFLLLFILFVTGLAERKSLVLSVIPSILLFIYQRYDEATGTLSIPTSGFQAVSLLQTTLYISGYFLYAFLPLSPLMILGLRSFRHIDMLSLSVICLIFTYMPVYLFYYPYYAGLWYRWALIIAIPVCFFAVEGLERLWKIGKSLSKRGMSVKLQTFSFPAHRGHRPIVRAGALLAIIILAINLFMMSYYIACLPENQINYFGDWNNYKSFIPTSMLQNSLSISDTQYVIKALEWVKSNLNNDRTILILHEAIDNWAMIVLGNGIKRIRINEENVSSPVRENTAKALLKAAEEEATKGKDVYTIWWVEGKGWYNISSLPNQFIEVKRFGDIAVYKYVS